MVIKWTSNMVHGEPYLKENFQRTQSRSRSVWSGGGEFIGANNRAVFEDRQKEYIEDLAVIFSKKSDSCSEEEAITVAWKIAYFLISTCLPKCFGINTICCGITYFYRLHPSIFLQDFNRPCYWCSRDPGYLHQSRIAANNSISCPAHILNQVQKGFQRQ